MVATTAEERSLQRDIRQLISEKKSLKDQLLGRPQPPPTSSARQYAISVASATLHYGSTSEARKREGPGPAATALGARPFSKIRRLLADEEIGPHHEDIEPTGKYNFEGPEFEIEKRPKVVESDQRQFQRNRRLFGGLLGHLERAKSQLEKEQDSEQMAAHKMQEEKVESKLLRSRANIEELKRREHHMQRQEYERRSNAIESELASKNNKLMQVHLTNHYECMRSFIGTETQPTLFWVPAVWCNRTQALQRQTKEWIESKIDSIKRTDYTYRALGDDTKEDDHDERNQRNSVGSDDDERSAGSDREGGESESRQEEVGGQTAAVDTSAAIVGPVEAINDAEISCFPSKVSEEKKCEWGDSEEVEGREGVSFHHENKVCDAVDKRSDEGGSKSRDPPFGSESSGCELASIQAN